MKHQIKVNNIRVYAHHGCLPEETIIGGNYVVNVILWTDFTDAATEDDLSKTIDYVWVNEVVEEEMAISAKLIEHVGHRIVSRLTKEDYRIEKLRVEIIKISPPINGDVESVAIVIEA
ncbi:MAG: dihydroneopterin aldolase [Flavobacteriales bacterium]|jgi:dihydroneopterin aldolase